MPTIDVTAIINRHDPRGALDGPTRETVRAIVFDALKEAIIADAANPPASRRDEARAKSPMSAMLEAQQKGIGVDVDGAKAGGKLIPSPTKRTPPKEQIVVPQMDFAAHGNYLYCKKCKVAFSTDVFEDNPSCPQGHANFMYTKLIPAGARTVESEPPPAKGERPRQSSGPPVLGQTKSLGAWTAGGKGSPKPSRTSLRK